jgi:glutathione S-transferase
MIIYGSTLSPYVRKVCVFAREKGLDYDLQPPGSAAHRAASPFGKMPAFTDGDFSISDSSAIVTYLEARHPDPALIPAEPQARARTIWYEELADTLLMAAGSAIFANRFVLPRVFKRDPDLAAARKAQDEGLPPLLDYLEGVVPEPGGFLVGDTLTLADIAVASPFATLSCIGVRPDERHPRTAAWIEAMHARPSFAAIIAGDQAMVDKMGGALDC